MNERLTPTADAARLASPSPQRLRAGLIAAYRALEQAEPPRVWF